MASSGPYEFAKYRRPSEDRDAESDSGELPTEKLGELLGRVSENSTNQINDLVGDFGRRREKLQTDGERIQSDVAEYRTLSEKVMQLTRTISESVQKVRGSADC